MGTSENLASVVKKQKELLAQLEAEYRAIENSAAEVENAALKAELEKLRADYEKAHGEVLALTSENAGLKNALYEQIYNEKMKMVNRTTEKMDIYFAARVSGEINRLAAIEETVRARIRNIANTLEKNGIGAEKEISEKLEEASALLDEKVTAARVNAARTYQSFSAEERVALEELKNEQISDEQVRAIAKKNNLERFVGLNLLNVVGIFLIIIGVITAARYTYAQLPDTLKGVMMFVLGIFMLLGGELLNRKKPNIFSLGITAGGIGVMYVAVAISYFGLEILSMYPALALCVLVTAVAFVLSRRYNAQNILVFALIGGYLPILSLGAENTILYGAMVYFVALNLLALLVSFDKKWRIASYIGLFLNIFGTIFIVTSFGYTSVAAEKAVLILYVLFAFLIYTFIPITGTYRTKGKIGTSDMVLLALNTFFSSFIMYGVFYMLDLDDYSGLLAIAFAVIYLLLGRLIEKKLPSEARTRALFYLTGLAFVVLVIPLQFGVAYLSLGWLAEGVAITVYAVLTDDKALKRIGLSICGLCLIAFLQVDFFQADLFLRIDVLFAFKYLAITLGSIAILAAYMYKRTMTGLFVKIYKYFAFANAWLYLVYIIGQVSRVLDRLNHNGSVSTLYLTTAMAIVGTFLMAYILPRIKLLSDLGTKIFSIVLYVIGVGWLFVLNAEQSPIAGGGQASVGVVLLGTLVLLVVNLLSVFAVRDFMKSVVLGLKWGMEWYPLVISGYFVLLLTQNLITQYQLMFSSAVITSLYVLTALAWILYGFKQRYTFVRKFGLGLALLSVVKLFLIDLSGLTSGYRIVTYFVLGVTLVAISFVYQYFSKRLELKEEADNVKEEN